MRREMRWQRAEAYGVEREEMQKYAEELAVDLREAEEGSLIPGGYFDEGSPTEPEDMRSGLPTILAPEDLGEDDGGAEACYVRRNYIITSPNPIFLLSSAFDIILRSRKQPSTSPSPSEAPTDIGMENEENEEPPL